MDKRIELVTYNQRRMLPLAIGGVLAVVAVGVSGMALLREGYPNFAFGFTIVALLGGIYGLLKLLKKLGAEPLVIDLSADGLAIHNQKTNVAQQVTYADITAYRFSDYNQTQELRLTLKNAEQIKISVNSQLHNNQGIAELLQEFEHRLAVHQELQPEQAPVAQREKSFFEKPISTVLLGLISAVMAWLTWMVFTSPQPVKGSVFTSYAFYLSYVAAWYAARERRAAKA